MTNAPTSSGHSAREPCQRYLDRPSSWVRRKTAPGVSRVVSSCSGMPTERLRVRPLRRCTNEEAHIFYLGKLKFNFKGSDPWSAPFIALLQGRRDEIILRDPNQLRYIADAAEEASKMPGVDAEKMEQLKLILKMKMGHQGLKAQLKPTFGGESGDVCEKLNIVVKWGGEFTHAARHQSRDIGENMSKDLRVMNK